MRRPSLGPAAPEAPAATSGDGRASAARRGVGRGRGARRGGGSGGGRCVRSVARSAAEARGPQCARRPQRHPPSGDPRGVRGAGPVSLPPLDPPRAWRPLWGSPSLPPAGPVGVGIPTAGPLPSPPPTAPPADPGSWSSPLPRFWKGRSALRSHNTRGRKWRGSPRVVPGKPAPSPHRETIMCPLQRQGLCQSFPSAPRECLRAVPAHRCPAQVG